MSKLFPHHATVLPNPFQRSKVTGVSLFPWESYSNIYYFKNSLHSYSGLSLYFSSVRTENVSKANSKIEAEIKGKKCVEAYKKELVAYAWA